MGNQSVTEFRFEPGRLGRHDLSGISNRHKLIQRHRVKREGHGVTALIHQFLQFGSSADTADEIDSGAGTGIVDTQDRAKYLFLKPAGDHALQPRGEDAQRSG